ncbi:MAG: hypothetical protein ACOCQD_02255 [archaeon]
MEFFFNFGFFIIDIIIGVVFTSAILLEERDRLKNETLKLEKELERKKTENV